MENIEYKYSDEFDGKRRKLLRYDCKCGNTVWLPTAHWQGRQYCTRRCPLKNKNFLTCDYCQREFSRSKSKIDNSKSGLNFCTRECKDKAQSLRGGFIQMQPSHYGTANGKSMYRKWAFDEFGKSCRVCGYEKDARMLDVDHIDGDRSNNELSNLQVLCVWHHALKTRGVELHDRD